MPEMQPVPPETGEFVKIRLGAEALWAAPLAKQPDGGWRVRLDNNPTDGSLKAGDEIDVPPADVLWWSNGLQPGGVGG